MPYYANDQCALCGHGVAIYRLRFCTCGESRPFHKECLERHLRKAVIHTGVLPLNDDEKQAKLDAAEQALAKSQGCAIEYSRLFDNEAMSRHLVEQELAGEKARVDIAERRSIAAGAQAEELQAQVIDLKAALRKAEARIEKLDVLVKVARPIMEMASTAHTYGTLAGVDLLRKAAWAWIDDAASK